MIDVILSTSAVRIEMAGWDRVWACKRSLVLPRRSISRVYRRDDTLRPPWCRCPGTAWPGVIIAGTYYGRGRKEFWSTRFREGTLVFDLHDAEYTRVVVDVADPETILAELAGGGDGGDGGEDNV